MLKEILDTFKNLEKVTYKIMKSGFNFCFILCLISTLILCLYNTSYSLDTYYIGIGLFKLSIYFMVEFIVCALVIDNIKNQRI